MKVREGKIPEGKGIFIYIIASSWNGSMASLADYLKENGYSWVAPKAQDGQIAFNSSNQQALLTELVPELKRVGIDLVLWGYVYGETTAYRKLYNWCDREAKITIEQIAKYKPVAWIVDAEAAYKDASGSADSAKKYMNLIRTEMAITNDAIPDIPIGFSSYKFPNSHNLPWTEFLSRSDFAAPQVYWWGRTGAMDSVTELDKSVAQYKAKGAENLPFVPAGTFRSDDATWWATVAQIDNFNDACYESDDIIGMNYWDLRFLQQRDELESALNDFEWEVDDDEVVPPMDCDCDEIMNLLTKINNKAYRIETVVNRLEANIADLTQNLSDHHVEVMEKLDELGAAQPNDIKYLTVNNDGGNVAMWYAPRNNDQGYPIFVFYPGDSSSLPERIYCDSGAQVAVYSDGRTRGDGGKYAWKVVMDEPFPYAAGSTKITEETPQLYVGEKFI